MTNEEKAREIAQSFRTARMFSKHPCEIAEDAAKEMAEWKEQQMIERITKLLNENCGDDWYIKRYSYDDAVLDKDELLKDIIQTLKEE